MGFLCKTGSSTSTQTTDIPDYIKTPLLENLDKASDLVKQPYQTYGGDRIEGFTQDQLDAFQKIRDMQGQGSGQLDAAMQGIMGLQQSDPSQVQAQTFDSAAAQQYMNPYTENVLDRARQRAFEADDIARQRRDARAIGAGAFGDNSRRFVQEAEAQSNLQDRMADMEAKQLANAYSQAQKAYATDAGMDLKSQQLNQAAGLSADKLNTAQALGAGQGIAGLVGAQQNLGMGQIGALSQVGTANQQMGQAGLDLAYSDFQNQQAYPYQQIGFMADLLQGAPQGTVTSLTQPTPSPFQSMAGLGLAGLGLYGQMGGFSKYGFGNVNPSSGNPYGYAV
jgi:hypothetical protein